METKRITYIKASALCVLAGLAFVAACFATGEVRAAERPYILHISIQGSTNVIEFGQNYNEKYIPSYDYVQTSDIRKAELVDQNGEMYAGAKDYTNRVYNLKPSTYTTTLWWEGCLTTFTFTLPLTEKNSDYKNKFEDLGKITKERKTSVRWMYQHGITTGVNGTNTYKPNDTVNRGSMAQFLHRFSASTKSNNKAITVKGISNLPKERQEDIKWLAQEGITVLDKDGNYNPQNSVNRGAMAELLYKTAGSPTFNPTQADYDKIKDINKLSKNPARQKAIAWLAKNNITVLDKNGNFNPNTKVNRGSMAQFMEKLYKKVITKPSAEQGTVDATISSASNSKDWTVFFTKTINIGDDTLKAEPNTPALFLGLPNVQRKNITSITFSNNKPTKCTSPYAGSPIDVGANKKKEVMACVSSDKTKVLIGEDGGVRANPNSQYLFYNLEKAPPLNGFADKTRSWDQATNLKSLFQDYGKNSTADSIGIPEFPGELGFGEKEYGPPVRDINMSHIFDGFGQNAKNAKTITLPKFLKNGYQMYDSDYRCFGCRATDMSYMFANFAKNAISVKTVTLPEFPDFDSEFGGFGRNATNLSHMFESFGEGASSATSVTIPKLPDSFLYISIRDGIGVDASFMFSGFARNAKSVKTATLPKFPDEFGNIIVDASHMFENFGEGATSATSISVPEFLSSRWYSSNGKSCRDSSYMFANFGKDTIKANSISAPDLSMLRIVNASHMFDSFANGSSAKTITVSGEYLEFGYDYGNKRDLSYMFANFTANTSATKSTIPVIYFRYTQNISSMSHMFYNFAYKGKGMSNDIIWDWENPGGYSGIVWDENINSENMFTGGNWNGHKLLLGSHIVNGYSTHDFYLVSTLYNWLANEIFNQDLERLKYIDGKEGE
jgi:hypothetical protein